MELVYITHGLIPLGVGHSKKGRFMEHWKPLIPQIVASFFLLAIIACWLLGRTDTASILGASGIVIVAVLAKEKIPHRGDKQ